MVEIPDQGWRPAPTAREPNPELMADGLAVCPASSTEVPGLNTPDLSQPCLEAGLGPVLEMWEVFAKDGAIRFNGASGGALSALGAFALEQRAMAGVLHVAQDPADPFRNITVLSRTRDELLERTGSRYAPASLCERLDLVESAPQPCAVIGQPSEIAALRKVESIRPAVRDKVGITLSFFCAGSPSMQGTRDLIIKHGIDLRQVTGIRYRGRGWPGNFSVWVKGKSDPILEMTYAESWAFLQRYRPWGVHLWPDGAGEHADISCGDPWYRKVASGEAGSSLVLARTERGRAFISAAIAEGYLEAKPIGPEQVAKSQENLLRKKGAVAGRLFVQRALRLPTPKHRGYRLGRFWWKLTIGDKLRSVFGTLRRIVQRGYHRPAGGWNSAEHPADGTSGVSRDARSMGKVSK